MIPKTNSINVKLPEWKERSTSATLKYAIWSSKKMELVAKLIRWKSADKAMEILRFTPKRIAKTLMKVVASAIANAKNNANLDTTTLMVKRVDVWKWMKIKRIRFAARSRIHHYQKYRAFVRVVLDNK